MIACFDVSALIYLIEGAEPFASTLRVELGAAAQAHPNMGLALSRLAWLECKVRPMRDNDAASLAAYDAFFTRADLVWLELTRDVVELATAIRARHGLRTPDALQAACCLQLGEHHLFFSGDDSFKRVAGLNLHLLR